MYAVAAILAIPVAIWSDRLGKRSPILFLFISITALGYVIAIAGSTTNRLGAVYAGIFIAVIGMFHPGASNKMYVSSDLESYWENHRYLHCFSRKHRMDQQQCFLQLQAFHLPSHPRRLWQPRWRNVI